MDWLHAVSGFESHEIIEALVKYMFIDVSSLCCRDHLKPASFKRWICSSDRFILGFWLCCIFLYDPLSILHHFPRDASSPRWETSQWPYLALKDMRSFKRSAKDCIGALLFLLFPDVYWTASKCTDDDDLLSLSSSSLDTISCCTCWCRTAWPPKLRLLTASIDSCNKVSR